jgi:hypothetical protein
MRFWTYYWDKEDEMDEDPKPPKPSNKVNLINPEGKVLFTNVPTFVVAIYLRKTYSLKNNQVKKVWRKTLESKGYKIIRYEH